MKRTTFWKIIQAIVAAALFAIFTYELWSTLEDCEHRRGTLVRTMLWYECIAVERR